MQTANAEIAFLGMTKLNLLKRGKIMKKEDRDTDCVNGTYMKLYRRNFKEMIKRINYFLNVFNTISTFMHKYFYFIKNFIHIYHLYSY